MPVDVLGQPVEVLGELPGKATLADPGRTDDADQTRPSFATGGMEQVLEQTQLVIATDEGRLECVGPVAATALRDDAKRAPGGNGCSLSLEVLLADGLVGDRRLSGPDRALPDEDRAGRGDGLQAGGRIDHVAGDHPLVGGTERDRRLAGQDPRPGLDGRTEGTDSIDEFQPGPDAPLGIVFVGDGRAPYGHDGVADELLDRAAVPADHVGRDLEVA